MRELVHQAMEEGALGVTTALGYVPEAYAKTPELSALASEAARCGGIYSAHIRDEGDEILKAVDETIGIAKASGAPAEIYHLKVAGRRNWNRLGDVIAKIEAARAAGVRITADMYTYTPGPPPGLNATMPTWVQAGGLEQVDRPPKGARATARQGHLRDERRASRSDWENLLPRTPAGLRSSCCVGFKSAALKPLTGKRLSEVARDRHDQLRKTPPSI